jgi:hypothetical protein
MTDHIALGELEQAHDDAARAARERIEQAEEYVAYYRSQIHRMQENFYDVANRHGVVDDPGFREELRRVTERSEENVHGAARVIAGFEEDLAAMTVQHTHERERLLSRM